MPVSQSVPVIAADGLPRGLETEADLVQLLRVAGPPVRGVLLAKYRQALVQEDIEDVLSQALMKAWQCRTTYDAEKGSLQSWFYCIANRLALDQLKHRSSKLRAQQIPLEDYHQPTAPEPENTPAPTPTSRHQALLAALQSLPEVQQKIIWADALGASQDGVSSEQLGAEIGLNAGTIRVYRKRALDKLRLLLTPPAP